MPGAWVWQLPPERTWGCPRMSRRLVTCQDWADGEKSAGGDDQGLIPVKEQHSEKRWGKEEPETMMEL